MNHRFNANRGLTPKPFVLTTKVLRQQDKNIELKGCSRPRKADLVARISEARDSGGLTPKPVVLTTIKVLRQQAKNIGLKGYSRLQKAELVEFISKARDSARNTTCHSNYALSSSAWCRGQPGAISCQATKNLQRRRRFPASQEGCERAPKSSVSSSHSQEISKKVVS